MSFPQRKYTSPHIGQITGNLQTHMAAYGYEVFELPIIEPADLFLIKAGDQIIHKLFTFERYHRQLALRPEFTAAAAYRYATSFKDNLPVKRWQFNGPVFEDDPNAATPTYQRFSIGAELIGLGGAAAEAEIISMAVHGLTSQGIKGLQLTLGHAGLTRQMLLPFGLDNRTQRFLLHHLADLKTPDKGKSYLLDQLDRTLSTVNITDSESGIDPEGYDLITERDTQQVLNTLLNDGYRANTMGGRTRLDIAQRLREKRKRAAQREQIIAALDFLEQWGQINDTSDSAFNTIAGMISSTNTASQALLTEWMSVIDLLTAYNIPIDIIRIQPDLARGWEYYTGLVFELRTAEDIHLGGGGRYDDLSRLIGGDIAVPAVGFAYYMDQVLEAIPTSTVASKPLFTISHQADTVLQSVAWAHQLRQSGIHVCLLPANQTPDDTSCITIDTHNQAHFAGQMFTLAQADKLINYLKQESQI